MLKLSNIHKEYQAGSQTVEALRGLNLTLRKNEFVAILGPSGCGKTTLLNIIGGLDRYTSGDLSVNGKSTKDFTDADWDAYRNRSVGFVFQSYNLIPHQSVLANVELALTLSGVSKAERTRRAKEALEKVGLSDQMKKRPNQMSGGQMQRVAIARALVNDPEILLADEPTGALDSETSVQIMDLLKEVARDRLVVMVTHNPDLADQYASRIIRLLDGQVISDSAPCEEDDHRDRNTQTLRKPSLRMKTALGLSLNNLLTKKTRTALVAFAGSIGIIGIALILALSTGVKTYINQVERDTLSSYPITIEQEAMDSTSMMLAFMGTATEIMSQDPVPEGMIRSNNSMEQMLNTMLSEVSTNDLGLFKVFLDENEEMQSLVSDIQYTYSAPVTLYRKMDDGSFRQVNPSSLMQAAMGFTDQMTASITSMGSSYNMNIWQELIGGEDLLNAQYDVLAGRWPKGANEAVLILNEDHTVTEFTLYALGLRDQAEAAGLMQMVMTGQQLDAEAVTFSYEDVFDMSYRLVLPTDLYQVDENGVWAPHPDAAQVIDQSMEVRIVGIVCPNEDAVSTTAVGGTIGYTSELTDYVVNGIAESPIVQAQLADPQTDIFTGLPFEAPAAVAAPESETAPAFDMSQLSDEEKAYLATLSEEEQAALIAQYAQAAPASESAPESETAPAFDMSQLSDEEKAYLATLSEEEQAALFAQYAHMAPQAQTAQTANTYTANLTTLGYCQPGTPTAIAIYPKDFESKERVITLIEGYNDEMEAAGNSAAVIVYVDYVGLLMSSVSSIVDAITYVLIAFVAISLVVSSIMIGIITYISVLERTREIGVLRSIGASKRDISKVFNAETLIVGLASGLMGILISWLLTFPANAIVASLTSISTVAILPLNGAIVLIIISMLLTLIAGLIPSRIAARKDPVVALRSE